MTAGVCLSCGGRRVSTSPYCTQCGWHENDAPADLDKATEFLAGAGLLAKVFGHPIQGTNVGPALGGSAGVPFASDGRPVVTNSGHKPASHARPHMLAYYQADRSS